MTAWKQVKGFEGSYEVSDDGQIRSLDKVIVDKNGHDRSFKGKTLKPDIDKDGYHIYRISHANNRKTIKGHRAVMFAFVGECPEGMQVAHRNGNPDDNRLANLYYATCKQNHADKKRHGTTAKGSRHGKSKINESAVLLMRKLYEAGVSKENLGEVFCLNPIHAERVVRREFWTHI